MPNGAARVADRPVSRPIDEVRVANAGAEPAPRSATATTGNSRPFAACTVITRTPSWPSACTGGHALALVPAGAASAASEESREVAAVVLLVLARQAHQLAHVRHPPRRRRCIASSARS